MQSQGIVEELGEGIAKVEEVGGNVVELDVVVDLGTVSVVELGVVEVELVDDVVELGASLEVDDVEVVGFDRPVKRQVVGPELELDGGGEPLALVVGGAPNEPDVKDPQSIYCPPAGIELGGGDLNCSTG